MCDICCPALVLVITNRAEIQKMTGFDTVARIALEIERESFKANETVGLVN